VYSLFVWVLAAQAPVDFQKEVRPILSDRCFVCHGPDAAAREADLRLDTRQGALADLGGYAAIAPGDLDESELIYRLHATSDEERMPPRDSGLSLTAAEIETLERWIEQGAAYTPHWSFVSPTAAPLEAPQLALEWSTDPLDHWIYSGLAEAGLKPEPAADLQRWLRRTSFALTGLPPSQADIQALASGEWTRADVVDRYLASKQYGERMASPWLDAARYADTYGYQSDVARRVWPYRDWVIRAYNENLPYDDFVRWQIAGDELPEPTRDQQIATAFQRLHRQTNEGGSVEAEYRVEYVSDRVHTTGTAFMGLTFECARCHDHRYDPISQREYFQLTDYFDDIDESGLYSHFTSATPTPALNLPTPQQDAKTAELAARVAELQFEPTPAAEPSRAGVLFAFDEWADQKSPGVGRAEASVRAEGHFVEVDGVHGKGVRLNGDEGLRFSKVGEWNRADAFTVACWLYLDESPERAVLLHRSRAWHDAASQGWQLLIEDGRLTGALVHFWPGDMAAIRSQQSLPVGEWVQISWSVSGSGKAGDMQMSLNGVPLEFDVVRDHLTRSITGGGPGETSFGARFRDRGFSQGILDQVSFFDEQVPIAYLAKMAESPETLPELTGAAESAEQLAAREALRKARQELNAHTDSIAQLMVMRNFEPGHQARLLARGAYDAPLEEVGRGVPKAIWDAARGQMPATRLEFANWLVDGNHPLTARVEVDRLWRTVFGTGLMRTPENWGSQGEAPTHPELLDMLALDFVESGWDRKAMIRRLVLSQTFAQDSVVAAEKLEADPENRLWGRGPAARLPAEMLRDAALQQAGLLVGTVGGPSVKPYQPAGLWREKSGQTYSPSKGDGLYRRSLYTFWKRTSPPPSMMIFDAAKRDVCVVKRQRTDTPLQALVLWNDPQQLEAARALAHRVMQGEFGTGPDEQRLAQLVLVLSGESIRDAGLASLGQLLAEERAALADDPEQLQALLEVGEWRAPEAVDNIELGAWTVLCSTLLSSELVIVLR